MRKVGDLSNLHDKYFDRGFRVIGISDESSSRLKERVVDERNGTFWIGADRGDTTMRSYTQRGSLSIPRFYLVDAHGVVVGSSMPSEAEIEELLDSVFDRDLGRGLHEALADVGLAYSEGAYGAARALAVEASSSEDAAVAADAAFVIEKIDALAEFELHGMELRFADLSPSKAYGQALLLSHWYEGTSLGTWAEEKVTELTDDPAVEDDKRMWAALRRVIAKEAGIWRVPAHRRDYQRKRLAKDYASVADKHRNYVKTLALERKKHFESTLEDS